LTTRNPAQRLGALVAFALLALAIAATPASADKVSFKDADFIRDDPNRLHGDPWFAVAGRFNEGGKLDLVTIEKGSEKDSGSHGILVGAYLGSKSGALTKKPSDILDAGRLPEHGNEITKGDFDDDNRQDVAFSTKDGVRILLGNGKGGFSEKKQVPLERAIALDAADFNRDGKQDLVATGGGAVDLSVMLGDGTGAFSSRAQQSTQRILGVVAADFDLDGLPDAAVVGNDPTILLGDGTGALTKAGQHVIEGGQESVVAADFNRDGKPDIAVNRDSPVDGVSILLGDGAGQLVEAGGAKLDARGQIVVSDFDHDGKQDVVVVNQIKDKVTVLLGDGKGDLAPDASINVERQPKSPVAGDFNGDGRPDLALIDHRRGGIAVLINKG
jgi:VCBS repeat protein